MQWRMQSQVRRGQRCRREVRGSQMHTWGVLSQCSHTGRARFPQQQAVACVGRACTGLDLAAQRAGRSATLCPECAEVPDVVGGSRFRHRPRHHVHGVGAASRSGGQCRTPARKPQFRKSAGGHLRKQAPFIKITVDSQCYRSLRCMAQ